MDVMPILEDRNPWWREPAARLALRHPVRRDLQPGVVEHLARREERRALLLLGPRQVGKTTLLLQTADDLLDQGWPAANLTYFDFADDRLVGEVSPRQVVDAVPVGAVDEWPRVFLFDEISRAERWDLWLKGAVDRREGRIVATDSASSLLRAGARESGQGRWDEARLEGLSFTEFARLNGDEDERPQQVLARQPNLLERYLALGGFPEHALSDDPSRVRQQLRTDVVERAILRDLAGRVEDPLRVRDLFVYLMQDSGAELNAANRANDLEADPRTVRAWVEMLEDTYLLAPLPRRSGRKASSRLRSQPRLYAGDHGLVNAFAAVAAPAHDQELRGRAFEAVVYRHLREVARGVGGGMDAVSYLRVGNRDEVDFVVRLGEVETALEVTASRSLRADKLARFGEVAERYVPGARRVLVYGGLVDEDREGVEVMPLARFLMNPEAVVSGTGGTA
jgi:hypothetical protein